MQSTQEYFVIKYQEQLRYEAEAKRAETVGNLSRKQHMLKEKEKYDRDLKSQATNILRMRQNLMEKHQNTFMQLQEIQQRVLDIQLLEVKFILFNITFKHLYIVETEPSSPVQWRLYRRWFVKKYPGMVREASRALLEQSAAN